MKRRVSSALLAAIFSLGFISAAAPVASAAEISASVPGAARALGTSYVPLISETCTYGTKKATLHTSLSNGDIWGVVCSKNSKLSMARTEYNKLAGSQISAKNIYEWTNNNGGTSVRRQYSVAYNLTAGNNKVTTWSYSNGLARPDSSNRCVRSGIQQISPVTQVFTTNVACNVA